jgi:hypothetical protein
MSERPAEAYLRHMRAKGCDYYRRTACEGCVRQGELRHHPACRTEIECLVGAFIDMEEPNP